MVHPTSEYNAFQEKSIQGHELEHLIGNIGIIGNHGRSGGLAAWTLVTGSKVSLL